MKVRVNFVSESNNVVFHYTTVGKLLQMLKSDTIEMTSTLGSSSEDNHSKDFYYLSTTRHRLGGYHLNSTKAGSVLIRLNSTKLRSNLKQKPVNYWGEPKNEQHRAMFNEAEDRFTSNKPQIKNAKKFMEDVTILFPNGATQYASDRMDMRHVIAFCKKAKIPIRVYYDKDSFLADSKSKAMPLSDFFVKETRTRKKSFTPDYNLVKYTELIYSDAVSDLGEDARKLYFDMLRYGERSKWEFTDQVKDDLNDARLTSRNQNPKLRGQLDKFVKHLRDRDWDLKAYVTQMLSKWSVL